MSKVSKPYKVYNNFYPSINIILAFLLETNYSIVMNTKYIELYKYKELIGKIEIGE